MTRTIISPSDLAQRTREILDQVEEGELAVVASGGEERIVLLNALDYRLLRALAGEAENTVPYGDSRRLQAAARRTQPAFRRKRPMFGRLGTTVRHPRNGPSQADGEPLSADDEPSTASHFHRPGTANRRPHSTVHRKETTNRCPHVMDHRPWTMDHRPRTKIRRARVYASLTAVDARPGSIFCDTRAAILPASAFLPVAGVVRRPGPEFRHRGRQAYRTASSSNS